MSHVIRPLISNKFRSEWPIFHSSVNLPLLFFALKNILVLKYMYALSHIMWKPVFGVCDQLKLKPACSAIEASWSHETANTETRDIILSRQWTTKVLIRLWVCAGWSASLLFPYSKTGFLMIWLNLHGQKQNKKARFCLPITTWILKIVNALTLIDSCFTKDNRRT